MDLFPKELEDLILDYKSDLEHTDRMELVFRELFLRGFLTKRPFLMRTIWWQIYF